MSYRIISPKNHAEVKGDLLRLMNRNFPWRTGAESAYRWTYEQSPFPPNSCWLAETEQGERIGFTALMPRSIKVGNRIHSGGQAANINVNAEHRTGAAAIKLQRALLQGAESAAVDVVFGVTVNAGPVLKRAGYQSIGTVARWVKPLQTAEKWKPRIPWRVPRAIVAWGTDMALRLRSPETWYRCPAGIIVSIDDPFDARFDRLWNSAAHQFPIAVPRTAEYLTWRFRHDPSGNYHVLTISDAAHELRGYLVFLKPGDPENGKCLSYGSICDLCFLTSADRDILFAEFCREMRRENAAGIQMLYHGGELITTALQRFGFYRRDCDDQVLAWTNPSAETDLANFVRTPINWHLTDADAKI